MKVLFVHNYYQSSSPSGEDMVFNNEVELLRNHNVQVATYTKHNDEIINYGFLKKLKLPFGNIWSEVTYNELTNILEREKPDICHCHNLYYLISQSAYYACKDVGIPVVQTLHNFRFFCINGMLMRNGRVCERCLGRLPLFGGMYGCYRNTRIYSIPLTFVNVYHYLKGSLRTVDAYIALTEFARRKFITAGLPAEKVFVKPNFLTEPHEGSRVCNENSVFIGRLSEEKGLHTLLDAAKILQRCNTEFTIKIVGDGPLAPELRKRARIEGIANIEFSGRKSHEETMNILRQAMFLIMPSICYEGFPMAMGEAYARGKPVIASNLVAAADLIKERELGVLVVPGDSADLAEKIKEMLERRNSILKMGLNARKVFEEKYTAEKNFDILMDIYSTVVDKYRK
jgi:glycosyltransferase involved in cell wall biosynthesis